MRRSRRGHGESEFLGCLFLIGLFTSLLFLALPHLRGVLGYPPAPPQPHDPFLEDVRTVMRWIFGVGGLAFLSMITIGIMGGAEEAAKMIGLGRHQWRSKKVFLGIRKGVFDRTVYFVVSIALAIALLWCINVRPAADFVETSFMYPIWVAFVAIVLISAHVWYRAEQRFAPLAERYHQQNYALMFNPEEEIKWIRREKRWKQKALQHAKKELREAGYQVIDPEQGS